MQLRIALPEVPMYIVKEPGGNLKGPIGSVAQKYYRKLIENSTFVIAELSGDSGRLDNDQKGNGSSFKELFLRHEADILGTPLEYGTISTFLTPTPQVAALPGAATHAPLLSVANQDVLTTLNIFPLEIMGIILVSIIAFGLFFVLKSKRDLLDACSSLARSLINQTNFDTRMTISKAMIFIWLIASFALMEIYEQAMNADMVSLDYSSIVDSVLDLDRHKSYKPVFLQGEYIREQFKRSKDPVKQRIWSRQNKKVLNLDFTEALNVGQTNYVYMGMLDGIVSSGEFFCGIKKRETDKSRPKYLISRNGFGVVNVATYYRANLADNVKTRIWLKSLDMAAGGHANNLFRKVTRLIALISTDSTPSCLCYAKEELYENVNTLKPINTSNMASFYRAYFILMIIATIAFLLEHQVKRLHILRRTNVST